ncbi:hypothetical protein QR90_05025 [Deinococcus radiopugnans]|uniref:Uncharacterized protein n=1 Tax=Deinococcus radiopugnans TaxID=57497 RepID=A0A0A7KEL8_9DEIO|nr:hypothetical protein QR90_05025 [Deinococcus radiopugnans]
MVMPGGVLNRWMPSRSKTQLQLCAPSREKSRHAQPSALRLMGGGEERGAHPFSRAIQTQAPFASLAESSDAERLPMLGTG